MANNDESDKPLGKTDQAIVKTDKKPLPSLAEIDLHTAAPDIFVHLKNTLDMTPEAREALVVLETRRTEAAVANAEASKKQSEAQIAVANARVEEAKATFSVPAEQETQRAKQVSYRQYVATVAAGGLAGLAWLCGIRGNELVHVIEVLALLAGAERVVTTALTGRKKPPEPT